MAKQKSKTSNPTSSRVYLIILVVAALGAIGYFSYSQVSTQSGINEVKVPQSSPDLKSVNNTTPKTAPSKTKEGGTTNAVTAPTKTVPKVKNTAPIKGK